MCPLHTPRSSLHTQHSLPDASLPNTWPSQILPHPGPSLRPALSFSPALLGPGSGEPTHLPRGLNPEGLWGHRVPSGLSGHWASQALSPSRLGSWWLWDRGSHACQALPNAVHWACRGARSSLFSSSLSISPPLCQAAARTAQTQFAQHRAGGVARDAAGCPGGPRLVARKPRHDSITFLQSWDHSRCSGAVPRG